MSELSVVLISRNQEWNIARLVESVLRETNSQPGSEVVLVDSASTDQTTQIAARYPISVLKLRSEQRLTASAGRYVGYKHTTGDLVLFLDGDMELCEGWLGQALLTMRSTPDVAVVCGRVIDRPLGSDTPTPVSPDPIEGDVASVEVRHGGGAAMYRRSVLEQVGTFNPFLYSDEEPSLCLRIRYAGYRILRLPRRIAYHYTAPAESFATFMSKSKGHFWIGYGQNMRCFLGTPLLWPYLRERGWAIVPAVFLVIGIVAAVASGLTGKWIWVALWMAALAGLTAAIAIRKRSLKRALLTLLRRVLILDGSIRGLWLTPYDPASYPATYDVIA